MNIEGAIWTPDPNDEDGDGDRRFGNVEVEVVADEEIHVRFVADGRNVAAVTLDRFALGVLAGTMGAAAREAIKV